MIIHFLGFLSIIYTHSCQNRLDDNVIGKDTNEISDLVEEFFSWYSTAIKKGHSVFQPIFVEGKDSRTTLYFDEYIFL